MANSDFAIGRLALAELPDAEALVAEAGWNQVAADWRMFLDFGTVYAVRAQGRVIATAACDSLRRVRLDQHGAGDGGSSAGAGLRRACCIAASPMSPRRASCRCSTRRRPAPRSTRRSDFRRRGDLRGLRRSGVSSSRAEASTAIEPIADDAWSALCAYDAAVFGNDRSQILARMRGRLPPANLFARARRAHRRNAARPRRAHRRRISVR